MKIIVLTGSRALLGRTNDLDASPLVLYPLEDALSEDEADIIETNTGVAFIPIHYPHYIKTEVIGGIIDITELPVNPISQDDK